MQQILSKMRKAIEEYHMIDEGDKIREKDTWYFCKIGSRSAVLYHDPMLDRLLFLAAGKKGASDGIQVFL